MNRALRRAAIKVALAFALTPPLAMGLSGCGGPRHASIFEAAKAGDAQEVQLFLDQDKSSARRKDGRGLTPLHWAAKNGDAQIVLALLKAGAPVDAQTPDTNATPLHEAAEANKRDAAAALLDRRAPIDAADKRGSTPLLLAAQKGAGEVAALLLERGADASLANQDGLTPLHAAAGRGDLALAQALLKAKAPLQPRDKRGKTPLGMARPETAVSLAKLLGAASPEGVPADPGAAARALRAAIGQGVPTYNAGDKARCADLYEMACCRVVAMPADALPASAREPLENALRQLAAVPNPEKEAWALRAGMDKALPALPKPAPEESWAPPTDDPWAQPPPGFEELSGYRDDGLEMFLEESSGEPKPFDFGGEPGFDGLIRSGSEP